MRVRATKTANGRSRHNGKLYERRTRTSTAKPNKALNQGVDHIHPLPICQVYYVINIWHVVYLLTVSFRDHAECSRSDGRWQSCMRRLCFSVVSIMILSLIIIVARIV